MNGASPKAVADESTPLLQPPSNSRLKLRHYLWIAALLPAIFPLYIISKYHVVFIWNDAWDFANLLVRAHHHTLQFSDFWQHHNEHRMPIPYAIMFILARLTHWNTLAEVLFGYAMVCVLSLLIAKLLRSLAPQVSHQSPPITHWIWAWFLINLLIFSPIQVENWGFGFAACQNFLPIPCFIGAMLLLQRRGVTWVSLLLSGLLIEIAALSLANGLIGWFVILPLIVLAEHRTEGGSEGGTY